MAVGFALAALAFLAVVYLRYQLRYHVSIDKLERIDDATRLWVYAPPTRVLTDTGLRLRWFSVIGFSIFGAGAFISYFASIFGYRLSPIPILLATGSGLIAGSIFESRLKRHISMPRLRAVEDPASLWRFGGTPQAVLDETGLRLNRYMKIAVAVFFIGMALVAAGIIAYGVPNPEDIG